MIFSIYRREPRGKWVDVEPEGVEHPGLTDAIRYYEGVYAHDDPHGTEILFVFLEPHRHAPRAIAEVRKVHVPPSEPRLVTMHWEAGLN